MPGCFVFKWCFKIRKYYNRGCNFMILLYGCHTEIKLSLPYGERWFMSCRFKMAGRIFFIYIQSDMHHAKHEKYVDSFEKRAYFLSCCTGDNRLHRQLISHFIHCRHTLLNWHKILRRTWERSTEGFKKSESDKYSIYTNCHHKKLWQATNPNKPFPFNCLSIS